MVAEEAPLNVAGTGVVSDGDLTGWGNTNGEK